MQNLSNRGIGATFTRLTIIADDGGRADRKVLCRCACGNERRVLLKSLRRGATKSCGCLNLERVRGPRKHGHTSANGASPTYETWANMVQRCTNPKNHKYPLYGGRGITVCERWRESFAAFLADMGERPDGKTIDRRDPNGNYEPGNGRWATAKEQANNRRPRRRGYTRSK